jgi:undecaprenyl-diphosphatase
VHIEFQVLDAIQSHLQSPLMDHIMPFVSSPFFGGTIWVGCAIWLYLHPKTRNVAITMAISMAIEVLICNVALKPMIGRIRPCDIRQSIPLLVPRPTDFSFPSGHTSASFAIVAALFFRKNKLWIPSLAVAMLISFSRLYLYVHYPTDILAGVLVGLLSGKLGCMLTDYLERVRSVSLTSK